MARQPGRSPRRSAVRTPRACTQPPPRRSPRGYARCGTRSCRELPLALCLLPVGHRGRLVAVTYRNPEPLTPGDGGDCGARDSSDLTGASPWNTTPCQAWNVELDPEQAAL